MRLFCILTSLIISHFTALAGEGWIEDFEKAKKIAAKEERLILMDFTGSDWCQPCKLLHKKYYDTDKFKAFAKEKLVLVTLDFPVGGNQSAERKAANEKLSKELKVKGFPTTIMVDAKGKELFRELGLPSVDLEGFIGRLENLVTKHPGK